MRATEMHMAAEQNVLCYLILTTLGGVGAVILTLVCIRLSRRACYSWPWSSPLSDAEGLGYSQSIYFPEKFPEDTEATGQGTTSENYCARASE